MGARTETFDLGQLALSSGEGRRLELNVPLEAFDFGGQSYAPAAPDAPVILDVARTVHGWSLRLRADVELEGPCMRCLEAASEGLVVDAREIDQPGGGEDLRSPYLDEDDLDMVSWLRSIY